MDGTALHTTYSDQSITRNRIVKLIKWYINKPPDRAQPINRQTDSLNPKPCCDIDTVQGTKPTEIMGRVTEEFYYPHHAILQSTQCKAKPIDKE